MVERQAADLAEALQRVGLPVYITDRNGVLTWANDAALMIFGDVRGKHFSEIVAREDLPLVREQFARKIVGGESTDYEVSMHDADGRRRRRSCAS
jgi:PAS domain S-box-containing protein